jgi:hypothetical protein
LCRRIASASPNIVSLGAAEALNAGRTSLDRVEAGNFGATVGSQDHIDADS